MKPGIGTIQGYKWSSYKDYMREDSKIVDVGNILGIISSSKERALAEFARFNHEYTDETFLDIGEEKEINENNVTDYINRYLAQKGVGIDDLRSISNRPLREELIRFLSVKSNLSLRRIAATLGLNREIVRKADMPKDLSL